MGMAACIAYCLGMEGLHGASLGHGIHAFHIGKGANVRYEEKHYGEGEGSGERILNPVTKIYMAHPWRPCQCTRRFPAYPLFCVS